MTETRTTPAQTIRTIVCAGCEARFTCRPDGECWCVDEAFRLPLPQDSVTAECLCPACLRLAAATAR